MFGSRTRRSSIRARVLAIAFVPSVALLLSGVALAGYLVYDAIGVRDFATKVHDAAEPGARFFAAVREERRLTLQDLASNGSDRAELDQVRGETDAAAAAINAELQGMVGDAPQNVRRSIAITAEQFARLPQFRQQIDAGAPSLQDAYDFYNRLIDEFAIGLNGVAQQAPDAETAYLRVTAMPLFTSADGMSRGDALAAAGFVGGGLTEEEFRTYVGQIGAYHAGLQSAAPEMIPEVRAQYEQLLQSEAWQRLTTVENAFLRGNQTQLPVPEEEWRAAARDVGTALMGIYIAQSSNATNIALDDADQTLVTSIIVGATVLLIALALFLIAWRLSNRLVQRLARLRADTLDIADNQMPQLVERVRAGESVDPDSEMAYLDHGNDEIGQVADAFNKAQQTAVAAAVEEAKTREGTKKVFLNIAHRSQVIVHRQLQALDAAERKQEDPDQLDMLFRLDHLSTRARRNAENLIILGGEQPGRQWRNPVALADLVRGATAETEDYKRVKVGKLPAMAVAGPAVGDLVHLLAELIDNATSFSPPQSRVEISGEIVGRGVVIEVEDQGLGIEPDQVDELNDLLRNPPDFSFMALSEEPRLGLFVVARLAAKHGVVVTLRESAYGGTRAIVLVLSDLLGPVPEADDASTEDAVPAQQTPALRRRPRATPQPAPTAQAAPAAPPAQNGGAPRELPKRRRELPQRESVQRETPQRESAPRENVFQDNAVRGNVAPRELPQRQRPAPERQQESRPPQEAGPQQPGGSMSPSRPPLPRRRRQQNLVPQLMETGPTIEQPEVATDSPEQARSRLSAFQRGTRQAREHDTGRDDPSGD
ncbi:sensor histidine kinase [Prauserella cavernicola]|uniref:histidine kinase n=1 Tax=Prauserella cavernicola TaxID=2800127 RepID=A0A934QQG9_9PSEU|nr:nitrate- and nitrite sensing domain-containing protein [Prauserella cavernicola]MBK1784276.1 sensor histidine kinase [Prauserella cavernicola]